tara:strand:- start:473 stop:946 length:474 start_codon:yes stop_codon:yes gene_type:complete
MAEKLSQFEITRLIIQTDFSDTLTHRDKLVLLTYSDYLGKHKDKDYLYCFVTLEQIATHTGVKPNNLSTIKKKLESLGYLFKSRNDKGEIYGINVSKFPSKVTEADRKAMKEAEEERRKESRREPLPMWTEPRNSSEGVVIVKAPDVGEISEEDRAF